MGRTPETEFKPVSYHGMLNICAMLGGRLVVEGPYLGPSEVTSRVKLNSVCTGLKISGAEGMAR